MTERIQLLKTRLQAIARAIEQDGHALALIGLGSAGLEQERLDAFSDLDFFVIVEGGHKARFIEDLSWLSAPAPLVFSFRNTVDGCKALSSDDVFYEFAIFGQPELAGIPFAPGRIIWKKADVPESIATPAKALPPPSTASTEWLLGEALSNLYIGMGRYMRGEKLSAARFVQHYALDRIVELVERQHASLPGRDPFSPERRLEQRMPGIAAMLPSFNQGYDRTPESADAQLDYLCTKYEVPAGMEQALRRMITSAMVDKS